MERDENSFERQKDADESISKDIHYSGQAGGDIWFGKRKLNTTKIRMQRMMLGVTIKDKLRNEDVRRRTTMTTTQPKTPQTC